MLTLKDNWGRCISEHCRTLIWGNPRIFSTVSSALSQPWMLDYPQAVSCLVDHTGLWGAMDCRTIWARSWRTAVMRGSGWWRFLTWRILQRLALCLWARPLKRKEPMTKALQVTGYHLRGCYENVKRHIAYGKTYKANACQVHNNVIFIADHVFLIILIIWFCTPWLNELVVWLGFYTPLFLIYIGQDVLCDMSLIKKKEEHRAVRSGIIQANHPVWSIAHFASNVALIE